MPGYSGDNAKWLLDERNALSRDPVERSAYLCPPPNFVELEVLIPTLGLKGDRRYWRQTSHAVYWRSG